MDIRRNVFIERVARHWNGLPRAVLELSSPEVLKESLNAALSAMLLLTEWCPAICWVRSSPPDLSP